MDPERPRLVPDGESSAALRALEDLRVIRQTLEGATSFTALPGLGGVAMGLTAIAAALIAASRPTREEWFVVWVAESVVALAIGAWSVNRRGRRAHAPLLSAPGRKFALALTPALAAGAVLTAAFRHHGLTAILPGTWLVIYGAAVVSASVFSLRLLAVMGLAFMAAGSLAFAIPSSADLIMAAGFGGLHIVFGLFLALRSWHAAEDLVARL